MSILGLVCLLLALVATLLLVLYWLQRREMRAVEQLSHGAELEDDSFFVAFNGVFPGTLVWIRLPRQ